MTDENSVLESERRHVGCHIRPSFGRLELAEEFLYDLVVCNLGDVGPSVVQPLQHVDLNKGQSGQPILSNEI